MSFRVVPDEPYFMSVNSSGHSFGQTGRHRVHDGRDGIRRRSVVQIFGVRPAVVVVVVVVLLRQLLQLLLLLLAAQPLHPFLQAEIFGVQNFEFPLNLSQTLSNIFRALFGAATQYAKCQSREPLLKGKDLYD
jgi:uncharacterized integral membrane protein